MLRELQQENARLRIMLEEQKAPAHIGANNVVKAVDATADIVMQDYKLTDLKDNVRTGESVAPKLPPHQQVLADNMFGGGKSDMQIRDPSTGQTRSIQAGRMAALGRRAIAGAFRGMAVAPNAVIPERMRYQPPLRMVREEKFNK